MELDLDSDSTSEIVLLPEFFMRQFALSRGLILGSLLLLTGCPEARPPLAEVPSPVESASPTVPPAPSPDDVPPSPSPVAPELSATGMGAATLGMTFGDLKQAMPEATFTVMSPFMVDFDAIAVSQTDTVQFYILYLAGDNFSDTTPIQGLLTEHPDFRTPQGIGPGSTIAEAEAAYGDATLSYNTENESREYVRFQNHPSPNMAFRTGTGGDAGIYPEADSTFHETQEYRPDATIQSVMVICLREGCAAPE